MNTTVATSPHPTSTGIIPRVSTTPMPETKAIVTLLSANGAAAGNAASKDAQSFFNREGSLGWVESQDGPLVKAGSSYERLRDAGIVPGQFLAVAAPDWIFNGQQEFILVRFLQVTARRDGYSTNCELHCRVMGSCRIDPVNGQLSYFAGLPGYSGLMLSPTLFGGNGSDALIGGDGADTLSGGKGNDYLSAGAGNDIYVFNLGDGVDTISNDDYNPANIDTLKFGAGITSKRLSFSHVGNNLEISVSGTGDKTIIENWYLGSAYQIERISTADNVTILNTDLERLIQPVSGISTLSFSTAVLAA